MWKEDNKHVTRLVDQCGSTFAAANLAAKTARNLMKGTNDQLLDSKVLSWAITGKKPDVTESKAYHKKDFGWECLRDMLCYVDDEDVRQSVTDSYRASRRARHLIYCYNSGLDEPRRSRVRILTRMAWEHTHQGGIT